MDPISRAGVLIKIPFVLAPTPLLLFPVPPYLLSAVISTRLAWENEIRFGVEMKV
jgi:hypothetical protein